MIFSKHPNRLRWLILACLLLLGMSQVLWIKRVWNEQKDILRQETNYLFQQTVMTLQDSLVRRSMTRNGIARQPEQRVESAFIKRKTLPGMPPHWRAETQIQLKKEFRKPTLEPSPQALDRVKVIVTATDSQPVSLPRGLGRVLLNIRMDSVSGAPADFVFDIQADTVSAQELDKSYTVALKGATLPQQFNLRTGTDPDQFEPRSAIMTDPAPAGLLQQHFFLAEFYDYQGYLLGKILPYVLFSLLLFCLTSLSFWLIFNNLKQQKKLSEQKNEFISNVTHELKTPLTTVGVALEALHDFEVLRNPEKTKEYLQISKLELERLNLLVDKVLRLSMFEQQALKLHLETLDLVSTTQQVVDAMALQAKSVGATIRFSAENLHCWVSCDRLHLTGVVYNLLDNALKYQRETPEIEVFIEHTIHNGQTFASLKVSDNGIGIAPEYQSKIFEKLFRVPVGDTHNVKGHGLGLSYVAHVVREHGGSVRVDSQLGKGSTFIVEIPAATLPPTA